jgi:murein DD-endopeptidase MepM/ murein hydrolase activator NlpD
MMNQDDTPTPSDKAPWSVSFVVGRRLITVVIPPYLILLVLLFGTACYALGSSHAASEQRRQTQMLAVLKQRNEHLQRSLQAREQERDQMVALAETRSQEIWGELENQNRELRRLWHMLGQPTRARNRQSLSSRGGMTTRDRYRALQAGCQSSDQELRALSQAASDYLASVTPSLVPCKGQMTSGFGYRVHPVYGYGKPHSGCDFTTPHGTPIQATASGEVVRAEWFGGYGKTVEIDHGFGIKTLYAHCDELLVKKGQKVRKGHQIATVGTTGLSSGPHCHYEVHKRNQPVDPQTYLPSPKAER